MKWATEGKLTTRETYVDGFENAPEAFVGLLNGKNIGKMMVRVVDSVTDKSYSKDEF
jgi:hypothetical protein